MKKILLGTTALIGAVALFAGAASAENPKVTVGGFADFQAGWVDEDLDAGEREYGFRNDTEVTVHVDGKTDMGLGYGAVIDLEADVTDDADNQGTNASRTYVYLDGGWGRLQLGSAEGSEYTLKIDASNIARATGGIDGDWHYFASDPAATNFISTPRLVQALGVASNAGDESTINNNKITYYSPRWAGFQFGVSYAPDLTDRGQTVTRTDAAGSAGDIWSGGINYEAQWNEVSFGAAATGEWGEGDDAPAGTEDIRTWNVGAQVGFAGFSVAGSYGDYAEGLFTDDANYYTLGAAYDFGPFGVSATWLDSELEVGAADNEFSNLVIGADYKLAEGLTPYVEVSFFEFDGAAAGADNDGTVVLVGTELAF